MDTRSIKKQTAHTPDHHKTRHGATRWFALYLSWTAATIAGGAGTAHAAAPDNPKSVIPDGACGPAHDPDHDRDHHFHKRCEHYRHRHLFHRGHGNNADMAVRTLLDGKGNAVLEATTGSFDDSSTPKGSIDRVDVRIPHADKKHRDDMTFKPKPTGPRFTTPIGRLPHGQPLTVSADISGIGRGNDHVSVDDTVQYRPDLAVAHFDVPASASLGLPMSLAATVREMMGDLGANADCILSADGAVIDQVPGIWVDAGGVVTCHFTATFTTPGQHQLHVDVANVRPGDYDVSNNGADGTVTMAAPFSFTASAYDATYTGSDATQIVDTSGSVLFSENDTFGGSTQAISLNGAWATPLAFPLGAVSARATSGGNSWSILDLPSLAAGSTDPTQGTCGSASDATGYNWITVCTIAAGATPATSVNISEFAGDVTYHSDGVCQQTTAFADCSSGYTWNTDTSSVYAVRRPLSDSLTINMTVSDAKGVSLQAFPIVPLTAYTAQNSQPQTCQPQPDGTQYCFAQQYVETGVRGSVSQ